MVGGGPPARTCAASAAVLLGRPLANTDVGRAALPFEALPILNLMGAYESGSTLSAAAAAAAEAAEGEGPSPGTGTGIARVPIRLESGCSAEP